MIEENKRENIREEIERAEKAKEAARLLMDNNFVNDAVSKLYYFLLYGIRALLLTKGLEPKSHEGALRLFGLHFVKEGVFPSKDSHAFSKLMKFREEADCNPSYVFTKEDFSEVEAEAGNLFIKIKTYLKEKDYLRETPCPPSTYKEKLLKEIEEFPEGEIPELYRFMHILRVELMQKTQKPMIRGSLKGIWKGSQIEEASFIEAKKSLFHYETR